MTILFFLILIVAIVLSFFLLKEIASHDLTKQNLSHYKNLWEEELNSAKGWEERYCKLAGEISAKLLEMEVGK